ncbi:DUF6274 family protein [Streptomyces sp. SCL15-6]|uniref:DUF6274 family protein n=1 Tax=Streptomyces sp. SCL15-6 TaxID=2967222 RepID=UPI002965E1E9|nr:DUF6274 family protein [Streptomyces sp. SCL15-6]
MAASVRHETGALLRAHLSAASSYRHLTRHCPICHRLLRLAWDSAAPPAQPPSPPPPSPPSPTGRHEAVEGESAAAT